MCLGKQFQTFKTAQMFTWAYHNRPYADFVLKVDTDTYLNWPKLINYFPFPEHHDALPLSAQSMFYFGKGHGIRPSKAIDDLVCACGEIYGYSQSLLRFIFKYGGNSGILGSLLDPSYKLTPSRVFSLE